MHAELTAFHAAVLSESTVHATRHSNFVLLQTADSNWAQDCAIQCFKLRDVLVKQMLHEKKHHGEEMHGKYDCSLLASPEIGCTGSLRQLLQ